MRITQATAQLKPATTDRARFFIDKLVAESKLLRTLTNFVPKPTQHQYRPATGGQTVLDRAVNNNFSPADLSPASLIAGTLSIAGFSLDYDLTYKRDADNNMGIDMAAWYDQEMEERAIETADAIVKRIVAGTGSSNQMKGLSTILGGSNVAGLGITCVINALTGSGLSTKSFDLTSSTNWPTFLELFEQWKAELAGDLILICNRSTKGKLATIARKYNSWGQGKDQFGTPVDMIDGIPIVEVENSVITNTEDDDTSSIPNTVTTSMYLATNRTGHWNINTNSGLAFYDVGELQDDMAERIKFEMTGKNEIRTKRAIRRIRNLKVV